MRLLTIGHGTMSTEEFVGLMCGAGGARVIDIRSAPGSRHNPQFGRAEMERWLPAASIAYQWERNADHMLTQEFAAGADELRQAAGRQVTAVMCSESLWWRCHRRLLSDYLMLVHDFEIRHIMHDTSLREHRLTEGVRSVGDHVLYDHLPGTAESYVVPPRYSQGPKVS